ncbi:UDP-N-acetylmuramoyl-tripeptide--D-alanyl-D-alanine ligase [Francisella frigiditurris]|uniref:UDP-N-acetylmuramoyl-tripeptide--D-alanyl-D-alanine ligase n=1 Tax=Francisella frigiditurris TaxID=1542390 RepID=A0A1J0KV74_9GAMM|nr:UDP-N-acetylmuramoyl-tripeptide--D-alanyl-D-alanine ligase [Francisella frigiditurris]APC97583.1 UDP-N-acetylmuramoyl-tripeptide--D-alanyl-D-alanine ligase family protein [Francisella frigiditurris]
MIKSLKQLTEKSGFEYVGGDVTIENISINSGDIKNNTLFVAIVANRDGHDFIADAIANGAVAVLVSKKQENINVPQIVCENTIKALRKLAETKRQELKMPIISLTGSCGKTSVKEMIVALLADYNVHFTKGNLNNYLGVPMTILEIPEEANFAVIEAGTSVKGEIKAAAEIIKPDVALITNIGASHLENLKSLDGVMQEKGELLKVVSKDGFCVINIDDERLSNFMDNVISNKVTCSMFSKDADIYIDDYRVLDQGYDVKISIYNKIYGYYLPTVGIHNIKNSLLAISCLVALGLKEEDFLENTKKISNYKGRFFSHKFTENLIVVDDTYNASAPSVNAAIDDLASFLGKKVLVISSMRELGDLAKEYHQQMGHWINSAHIDRVFLFGDEENLKHTLSEITGGNTHFYKDKKELEKDLLEELSKYKDEKTKLIVKGARSYKMEEILDNIKGKLIS